MEGNERATSFDVWWPRVRQLLGAVIGFGVIVYETIIDHADRPWLYAAALAATGIPVGRAAEDLLGSLGRFTGEGPGAGEAPKPTVQGGEKEEANGQHT